MLDVYVAPRRGAWIEIRILLTPDTAVIVAPRRGAWIEISKNSERFSEMNRSPLAEGRGLK